MEREPSLTKALIVSINKCKKRQAKVQRTEQHGHGLLLGGYTYPGNKKLSGALDFNLDREEGGQSSPITPLRKNRGLVLGLDDDHQDTLHIRMP